MRTILALALAGAALAAAGCGGDDEQAPSREDFVSQASGYCAQYNARLQRIQRDIQQAAVGAGADGSLKPYVAPLTDAQDLARFTEQRFARLGTPEGDEAIVDEMNELLAAQTKLFGRAVVAARRGQNEQFQAVNTVIGEVTKRQQRTMQAYGVTPCGSAG